MPSVTIKKAQPPLVLALDVGTTSVRAELYDRKARDVRAGNASAGTPLTTTSDGAATLDPEKLLDVTLGVIDEVMQAAEAGLRPHMNVDGVPISTFWHSFLGIDAANR